MMDIYVVRHGQSESNLASVYCGWGQVSLTEKGFADAVRAGEFLRGISFERVYSSDLLRAIQTCEIGLPDITFEQTSLLREISIGTLYGLTPAKAVEMYGEPHRQRSACRDFTAYEGENTSMQYERVAQFMCSLEESDIEGNVAVFCHEGTVKCMLDYVLQVQLPWKRIEADNGSVAIFSWNGSHWKLKAWNIVK